MVVSFPRPNARANSGSLIKDARFTRTGAFPYLRGGKIVWEARIPEEVFKPESIATLDGATITIEHPQVPASPDNFGVLGGGIVKNAAESGRYLAGDMSLSRQDAIDYYNNRANQLSCGYDRDLDPTPFTIDGIRCDFIQRNIIYNHVAIVEKGRAGEEVRIIDSSDFGDSFLCDAALLPLPGTETRWGVIKRLLQDDSEILLVIDSVEGTVFHALSELEELERQESGTTSADALVPLEMPQITDADKPDVTDEKPMSTAETNAVNPLQTVVDSLDSQVKDKQLLLDAAAAEILALKAQLATAEATNLATKNEVVDSVSLAKEIAKKAIALQQDTALVLKTMASNAAAKTAIEAIEKLTVDSYCEATNAVQRSILGLVSPTFDNSTVTDSQLPTVYEAVMSGQRAALNAKVDKLTSKDTYYVTAQGTQQLSRLTPGANAGSQLSDMLKELARKEENDFNSLQPISFGMAPLTSTVQ